VGLLFDDIFITVYGDFQGWDVQRNVWVDNLDTSNKAHVTV
jgi:hypothetical protein